MNPTINQYAYTIRIQKDTILIQTKTHRDLLEIQAVPAEWVTRYNLSLYMNGIAGEILHQATEQELNDKIVELCSISLIEEDV